MQNIEARPPTGGARIRTVGGWLCGLGGLGASIAIGLALLPAGCGVKDLKTFEPNGLGNVCTIEGAADAPPTTTLVGVDVMSCASSVCLRPALQQSTNTAPLCTQGCDTDLDCLGGQLRDPSDPQDFRCHSGFSCQMPIPNLSGVALACQKVCVCRDFTGNAPVPAKAAGCP